MTKKQTKKKTAAKKKTSSDHMVTKKTLRTPAKKKTTKKRVPKKTVSFSPIEDAEERVNNTALYPWPLRPYQKKAEVAFNKGKRRQGLFWHRRAGKDVWCLTSARIETRRRVGTYVHFFPKHVQARRALWNGIDPKKGANFIDIAFGDQEVSRNNAEMSVEMYNGSMWQLLGSDNYDRIVGGNIVGAYFSEWALCDPRAWDFIRPMLLENAGHATFITTFRGRNHAWQMAKNLANNPEWYIDIMGVDKSTDVDGNRIITDKMIESERASGMSESLIQQEYYCNPEATSDGAIYGKQIDHLRNDPARNLADWNPSHPVYCVWNFDLPVFASYIMLQPSPRPQILDCGILEFTSLGEAVAHVNQSRWPIQNHFLMSDQRDMAAELQNLALRPMVLPQRNELVITTQTGAFIEQLRVDGEKCDVLLDALSGYVRKERFIGQAGDIQFGPDPLMSWHWRLATPLESFAAGDYAVSDTWGPKPDYSHLDRAAKIIL